jgi:hypothetical protein
MPGGGSPAGTLALYYPATGVQASFPYQIEFDDPFTISWVIRDAQGDEITNVSVQVEQKLDNGAWNTIYTGTNSSYGATISSGNYTTVTFRITAGDNYKSYYFYCRLR